MPAASVYPMNEVYRWDPAEGVIGVLGVAPAATADFYRRVTALIPARKDWEHVRVIIDSNPKLPSRGRHLELGETDPSPYLREGIRGLAAHGASVVAVPCNTAHILYDRYAADAPVPVPNMVAVAVEALLGDGSRPPQRVAILGSRQTRAHDLYGRRLRPSGGDCLDLGDDRQEQVSSLIELVKTGRVAEATGLWPRLIAACVEADAFVIACTELSALPEPDWGGRPWVDASEALARHCLACVRAACAA